MKRPRTIAVAALVLVGVAVAGWAASQASTEEPPVTLATTPSPSGIDAGAIELTETEGLPSTVPLLTVGDVEIHPLYLSWHQPGEKVRTLTPASGAIAADYPTVDVADTLDVALDSPVRPAVVNARFYCSLGNDGLPNDAEDSHVECLGSASECAVHANETETTVKIAADPAAIFTVVEVFYYNPGTMSEVPFSIVTYGFNTSIDG